MATVQQGLQTLFDYVSGRMLARIDGLTDNEYLWEPAPRCWSVRPGADGRWTADLGPRGTPWTDEDPPPITTIGWRLWHLGATAGLHWPPHVAYDGAAFVRAWFRPSEPPSAAAVGTAREALELVRGNWVRFGAVASSFNDADLFRPMGDIAGPFAADTLNGLLLHIADELIHHGAEVALLRDLYRSRR